MHPLEPPHPPKPSPVDKLLLSHSPGVPKEQLAALHKVAHNVYELPTLGDGIKWMHVVCRYPAKDTWLKAIRAGNFVGWPLLTVENVHRHYPETDETPMGHLDAARANTRSTKTKYQSISLPTATEEDLKPLLGKKGRDVYIKMVDTWDMKGTIYSDQTGKFPVKSRAGNRYIMVMVKIDSNYILVAPMKNKSDDKMIATYQKLLARIKRTGREVKKHVLDNECSDKMRELIKDECLLELCPPGIHRRNIAEVAIKSFKKHFLSVLAGLPDDFPWSFWDRLLPQTVTTFNLLRQSNATPTVSAYAHMHGNFDYNRMPLAPMGCPVQVHVKSKDRKTWDFHSEPGHYLFTSPDHYQVHNNVMTKTKAERLSY